MENKGLNTEGQKAGQKSWIDGVLESMDVAGDAIMDFIKNPLAQPKYLTACGGLLALLGTMLPWTYAGGLNPEPETVVGFATSTGIPLAVFGLVIIPVAIFGHTKPGKANSPASSVLALVALLVDLLSSSFIIFIDSPTLQPSFGCFLSVCALVLTFIFGLIPNPKQVDIE